MTIYAPSTSFMNVLLLCVVLPLFLALLVSHAWLAYRLYYMAKPQQTIAWGGFHGRLLNLFVATFLLSSFGCISTFVLYASMEAPETSSIFLFVTTNVACITFDYALLHNKQALVLACLWTNILVFVSLFVYTLGAFDPRADLDNAPLIVATHVCNFVAVFHVFAMDLMVWYTGWIEARAAYEASLKIYLDTQACLTQARLTV